jgi:hypothetical protein
MIVRALDLCEALDTYAAKLQVSKDDFDTKTFEHNYLFNDK